jgi:hypothetical protein
MAGDHSGSGNENACGTGEELYLAILCLPSGTGLFTQQPDDFEKRPFSNREFHEVAVLRPENEKCMRWRFTGLQFSHRCCTNMQFEQDK